MKIMGAIKKVFHRILGIFQISSDLFSLIYITKKAKSDPLRLIEAVFQSKYFRPSQIPSEIVVLMELIQKNKSVNICEIGCFNGGTLYLLSQAAVDNANFISIDINYSWRKRILMRLLLKPKQKFSAIQGDSKSTAVLSQVKDSLEGKALDLLLIDGDHSFEGVKADFEIYAPLVRAGGMIAFHDINPDLFMRKGIKTGSYVGGVPGFWKEIKGNFSNIKEVVENKEQDGFGIGILVLD